MGLKEAKKAHFIGIGGVGMSATALLIKSMGIEVSGSDETVYDPILSLLSKETIKWHTPYAATNIPADADIVVVGKNAKLVPETNVEVKAAQESGKKIYSFPEVLGELSQNKETIVVAGSYGKSTSDALLAHCLESAGLDPSYFIGAVPLTPVKSARIGSGNYFVLEGDEYPSSNTDSRSKFLHFHPSHLFITPLAHDHFNVFPTPADYLKPFKELVALVPQSGTLVICTEGTLSTEFMTTLSRPAVTYGLSHGDFQAANISWGEQTSFDITKNGQKIVSVKTTQLGEHNVQNIVGVAALLFTLNAVTPEQFATAVASFKGIKRRLDKKSDKTFIPIYEGFGSSYEKLKSAIAAIQLHYPTKRLIVAFEPHTFSWRNRESLPWYDTAFTGAEEVFVFEPPQDGKESQLSLAEMVERIKGAGIVAHGATNPQEILAQLEKSLHDNDVVLISTSGDMGGLIEKISVLAERMFPR